MEIHRGSDYGSRTIGETKNVSSGGVLFTVSDTLSPGDAIHYTLTLPGTTREAVQLRCVGKVLRIERMDGAAAATLERYEFVRGATRGA